jgi:hypothetical protein
MRAIQLKKNGKVGRVDHRKIFTDMCRVQNGIEYLNERIFFFLLQSLPSLKIAVSCCQTLKKGKKVKKTIGNVRFFFPVFSSLVSSKSLATRCVPNWQSLSSEW